MIWHQLSYQVLFCASFAIAFSPREPLGIPRIANGRPLPVVSGRIHFPISSLVSLYAAGDSNKKKRRRRKTPDAAERDSMTRDPVPEDEQDDDVEQPNVEDDAMKELLQIKEIASFQFNKDDFTAVGTPQADSPQGTAEAIPLPDIKEMLKKKEGEEKARILEESLKEKRRIKRSDKAAFTRLLEQQPYSDADDSLFEKEEYTTVSALLGEGSKPFLGIPTGPLQVGHFVGSLGIILCAFVDYPGFPLTNLPTPLRDFLQEGLGITYAINLVLAVLAVFKAGERGQPTLLWVAKTFSVGGLAYDQLTQLPTLEEAKKSGNRKR